jgi:hypothetical protein
MPKSNKSGKSIVGELMTLVDLISHDDTGKDAGKDIEDIEKELGDWIVQLAAKRSIYSNSNPYKEVYDKRVAKSGKDKLDYNDFTNNDKSSIGKSIIEVLDELRMDPRFPLYDENAKKEDIERVAGSLANSEALKKMSSYSKSDLIKELRNKGISEIAAEMTAEIIGDSNKEETKEITLSSGKKVTTKKRASMALPEREFEGLVYLKTFEKFRSNK